MKWTILSAICLSACVPTAVSAATIFRANLTGAQEVPPVATSAFGTAELVLNDAMDELSYDITINGLDFGGFFTPDPDDDMTRMHIHSAPAGVNGGIVFGMLAPTHDFDMLSIMLPATDEVRFTGKWNAADVINGAAPLASQLVNLFSEGLYINVHTTGHAGGEIRGQIFAIPEPNALLLATVVACLGFFCCRRS